MSSVISSEKNNAFNPALIQRPHPRLMRYYFFCALLSGPAFPFTLLALWMRYATLRYKFDEDGISTSYGVFFRREINLTFRRIQDIHLTYNLLQRWMGLAKISLQTAAGSAQAEMVIEGVLEANDLRDYLYARMRGARDDFAPSASIPVASLVAQPGQSQSTEQVTGDQTLQTLVEIRDALQTIVNRQGARP